MILYQFFQDSRTYYPRKYLSAENTRDPTLSLKYLIIQISLTDKTLVRLVSVGKLLETNPNGNLMRSELFAKFGPKDYEDILL